MSCQQNELRVINMEIDLNQLGYTPLKRYDSKPVALEVARELRSSGRCNAKVFKDEDDFFGWKKTSYYVMVRPTLTRQQRVDQPLRAMFAGKR